MVLAVRTLLPGDGGHSPIGGLSVQPTPLAQAPGVALVALGTLAFGAVLGPRGAAPSLQPRMAEDVAGDGNAREDGNGSAQQEGTGSAQGHPFGRA